MVLLPPISESAISTSKQLITARSFVLSSKVRYGSGDSHTPINKLFKSSLVNKALKTSLFSFPKPLTFLNHNDVFSTNQQKCKVFDVLLKHKSFNKVLSALVFNKSTSQLK